MQEQWAYGKPDLTSYPDVINGLQLLSVNIESLYYQLITGKDEEQITNLPIQIPAMHYGRLIKIVFELKSSAKQY